MGIESVVSDIYARSVEALDIIRDYIHETPIDLSSTLSKIYRCSMFLKYENLQKTGSFKARGALYKIYKLARKGTSGIVAASSGNHAQGVAYASSIYNIKSYIFMPKVTPASKVNAVKSYGAEVIIYGDYFDEAYRKALEFAEERKLDFVHPFNDPDIIAGQGTIGHEILKQLGDVDIVLIPVGGGGLISGIAVVLKKRVPRVKIIGVEPERAPKFIRSLEAGRIIDVDIKPSIADGLLAKRPGELTFEIVREYVDDIVAVSEDYIARAVYYLMERNKIVSEGAGAIGLAAVLENRLPIDLEGKRVLILISGGNVDLTNLYRIIIRGLSSEGRLININIKMLDAPGRLKRILDIVYRYNGNIVDIIHRRIGEDIDVGYSVVELLIEIPSVDVRDRIVSDIRKLKEHGYEILE